MKRRAFKQIVSGFLIYGLSSLPSSAAILYTSSTLRSVTSYSGNWINVTGQNLSVIARRVKLNHRSIKVGTGGGGSSSYSIRVRVYSGGLPYSTSGIYIVSSSTFSPLTIPITTPSSGSYNITVEASNSQSYSPTAPYYRYDTNLFQIEN